MNPKVSIIVPNFNHGLYLEQRLNSIIQQTYQDFEIILLDDFSTDESVEILQKFAEKYNYKVNHLIINSSNSGSTFIQWQKGIELAIGQYIWIAESDDFCEPTLLDNLMEGFINPNCVISFSGSIIFDQFLNIIDFSKINKFKEYTNGNRFIRKKLIRHNTIFNASMAVFSRDAYLKISKNYLDYKFCGDWVFWINIAKQGDVYCIGKLLNYFRKHSQDVSGKAYSSGLYFEEYIMVLKYLLELQVINKTEFKNELFIKRDYIKSSNIISNSRKKELLIMYKQQLGSDLFFYLLKKNVNRIINRFKH